MINKESRVINRQRGMIKEESWAIKNALLFTVLFKRIHFEQLTLKHAEILNLTWGMHDRM